MFDDALIDVVASQSRVTMCGQNSEDAIDHLQDGDVKSASSQVIHGNSGAFLEAVQTVGQGRRGWLMNDSLDFEPSLSACFQGGLALSIIEIGGHRNHRSIKARFHR